MDGKADQHIRNVKTVVSWTYRKIQVVVAAAHIVGSQAVTHNSSFRWVLLAVVVSVNSPVTVVMGKPEN